MPWGLKRYYGTGGLHFITWSCYHRRPLLDAERARDLLLTVVELMRERYRFGVVGYVVMREHVHVLMSDASDQSGLALKNLKTQSALRKPAENAECGRAAGS